MGLEVVAQHVQKHARSQTKHQRLESDDENHDLLTFVALRVLNKPINRESGHQQDQPEAPHAGRPRKKHDSESEHDSELVPKLCFFLRFF